jgi:hypothetical protein
MKKTVNVSEKMLKAVEDPSEAMYQDPKFLDNYRSIMMARGLINEEMQQADDAVKDARGKEALKNVREMIEAVFLSVDDTILGVEDSRTEMAELVKKLLKEGNLELAVGDDAKSQAAKSSV